MTLTMMIASTSCVYRHSHSEGAAAIRTKRRRMMMGTACTSFFMMMITMMILVISLLVTKTDAFVGRCCYTYGRLTVGKSSSSSSVCLLSNGDNKEMLKGAGIVSSDMVLEDSIVKEKMGGTNNNRYNDIVHYLNDGNGDDDNGNDNNGLGFFIREATYQDLPDVSRILVEAFYPPHPLYNHYHLIKELARLQNNFSYDSSKHLMLVAIKSTSSEEPSKDNGGGENFGDIIAFCDIDARPPKARDANTPPRPYFSDLAVGMKWRRQGIASSMIVASEVIVEKWQESEMYLRVEASNEAALLMYAGLGYEFVEHPYFGVKDTTMLLRRNLVLKNKDKEGDLSSSTSTSCALPL